MIGRRRIPRAVFVDSSAYCAVTVERDDNHTRAVAILKRLGTQRVQLVTTNLVLAETHALILNRSDRSRGARKARQDALETIRAIYERAIAGGTRPEYVTRDDEGRALGVLDTYEDKAFPSPTRRASS
jgi:predicted nucleic acid-binding protein